MSLLERHWYRPSHTWLTILLLPLSWLFRFLVSFRRFLYRYKIIKTIHIRVPVIVVGNITVGGTGKTPFVIWLANYLQTKGFHPGIVTRGVGGKKNNLPQWIDAQSKPETVGDEALLLSRNTQCPVVICVDRVAAVEALLQKTKCDVVISDDGLQHYRLGREIEIAIVDGAREFGNAHMLPAGPLREPIKRLSQMHYIVVNKASSLRGAQRRNNPVEDTKKTGWLRRCAPRNDVWSMELQGDQLISLQNPETFFPIDHFKNKTVHAIAAIGNPKRFFSALRDQGIQVIEHTFPDHYLFCREDIYFNDELPVIMTEKDAVKCMAFADERHWYLPVKAEIGNELGEKIINNLTHLSGKNSTPFSRLREKGWG